MRKDNVTRPSLRSLILHAIAYALWVATILMSLAALLQVLVLVSAVWVAAGGDRYTASAINQVCILLGGLAAFVYVMWLEDYYGGAVRLRVHPKVGDKVPPLPQGGVLHWLGERDMDILVRRFALSFAIPLALFLLSFVAYSTSVDGMTALH